MKTSRHCLGSYSPRQLARDLVALLEQDMHYIGWFASVARTYPADAPTMDWPHAMDVARAALMQLRAAEAFSRVPQRSEERGEPGRSSGPLPRAQARTQDHRARVARPGAISGRGEAPASRNPKPETRN